MNRLVGVISIVVLALAGGGVFGGNLNVGAGAAKLSVDPASGRVVNVSMGGKSCVLPRAVPESGFAVWDHAGKDGWQPLVCKVSRKGKDLQFKWAGNGLSMTADMVAVKNGWEIKGNVARTGAERYLSLRFGLPVDVQGWVFWKDILRKQTMDASRDYTITSANKLGSGYIDFIPMTSISCDRGALGYAVRMDEQWFHHTAYRADSGIYGYIQDFALIDGQKNFEKSAPFHFYILAPSGSWGLRAVTKAYFDLFPQWRGERADHKGPEYKAGGWIAWGDIAIHSSPLSDFGLMYHEGPSKEGYATCDAMGYYGIPYIEPSMYQQYHGELDRAPTYDETYARLKFNAEAAIDQVQHPAADAREWVHGMSASILKSTIHDEQDQPLAPAAGNWPWIGGSNFGAQFPLNLDPDIPGGVGQYRLEECRKMIANPSSDGVYLDSYCAHFAVTDFSRTNIQASRVPPTFNADLKPCVTVWSSLSSWVSDLDKMLPKDKHCVLPNMYTIAGPTSWQCMDILGKEWWNDPTGGLMARLRQMGYHKVLTQLPSYEDKDYTFLKQLLVFDVVPGGYGGGANEPPEKSRANYRKLMPVFRTLHELMWQPVTLAASSKPGVVVERYGNAPGPVAFVVSNIGEPGIVDVDIEKSAVPGGFEAWCYDPLHENPLNWKWKSGKLTVRVTLDSDQTAVFVVGGGKAQSKYMKMWADDRLFDVDLCFKDYKHRNGTEHPQARLADRLKKPADMLKLASTVKPDSPITRRIKELLTEAANALSNSQNVKPAKPAKISDIKKTTLAPSTLPFSEEFDGAINPAVWDVTSTNGRIETANGKVTLDLKDAISITMGTKQSFDFRFEPIVLESRFINNQKPSEWYLGTFISVRGEGDYLMIRIDNGNQVRLENNDTAMSDFTAPVFDYKPLEPNKEHSLKFFFDSLRYRLEIDGELVSEGNHNSVITRGNLNLTVSSGHQGHGDTWDVDYVRLRRPTAGEWKK